MGTDLGVRFDAALDTIERLLRVFGREAFDLDERTAVESRAFFDAWSRHATNGSPPPGSDGRPTRERAWRELVAAFTGHRRAEVAHVQRMRELVGTVVRGLRDAVDADDEVDAAISLDLLILRRTSDEASLDELRAAVRDTVSRVQVCLSERRKRHESQLSNLASELREKKLELEQAQREAATDGLTQLFNRASLDTHLARSADQSRVLGEPCSLLLVDIDHFKKVNDLHGHLTGDAVLKEVANAIVRVASRDTDFVARYGGEEIAVVLAETPRAGAVKVAERILSTVRQLEVLGPHGPLSVTVSVGVAELEATEAVKCWVERTDRALYAAKDGGRDRAVSAE